MKKRFYLLVLCGMVLASRGWAQETAQQDIREGNRYYNDHDYPDAISSLRSALELEPHNARAHQLLGNAYFAEGRKAEALAEYQLALTYQPDNPPLKAFVRSQQDAGTTAGGQGSSGDYTPRGSNDLDKPHAVFGVFGGTAFWGGIANQEEEFGETEVFNTGLGGGVYVGCQFDRHFSVALRFSEFNLPYQFSEGGSPITIPGAALSLQEWQLTTVCKYIMGSSGFRPYILVGLGTNFCLSTETEIGYNYEYATTAPLFQFGAGADLPLGREWDLYVQGEYDLGFFVPDNVDQSFSFFPITIGVQYNMY
jgi:hypothetical protein